MLKPTSPFTNGRDAPTGDTVGVAVVGLGYWGPNLLRVLADNPGVENPVDL